MLNRFRRHTAAGADCRLRCFRERPRLDRALAARAVDLGHDHALVQEHVSRLGRLAEQAAGVSTPRLEKLCRVLGQLGDVQP